MNLVRMVGRPLLGWIFISSGIDTVRNPAPRAAMAGPLLEKVRATASFIPADDVAVVRANGAAQATAGALLATGKLPRLASLVLASSIIPTTIAGHPYWTIDDEAKRAQQKVHFNKNLAVLGGLLLAVVDTAGRPSVSWRIRHAAKRATNDRSAS